jgi:hypothetical protein
MNSTGRREPWQYRDRLPDRPAAKSPHDKPLMILGAAAIVLLGILAWWLYQWIFSGIPQPPPP